MENCKKTCLQGLVKPGPWSLLQPRLVWGSSSPRCRCCVCKEHAGGFNMWTEGLPYPPKQNRAAVERTCFQKCGVFLVCGMAGTSKLRHRSVHGQGSQPRDPREPQGHQQDTPGTATLSLVQVLYRRAAKSWLPCTTGLVRDTARKMP